jgi:glycerophosphoryl diester phosphodiesterase
MMRIFIIIAVLLSYAACTPSLTTMKNNFPAFDKQGHRGSRGLMPENTIPAMLRAIDEGVTTLEMDVVISKDKKVVVSHDPYFHHNITTTPDGKTLTSDEAKNHLLYQMTYDSIKKYDVGLKPHPTYPQQQKIAVHKPLLTELIKASEVYAKEKNNPVNYNIEIKSLGGREGKTQPPVTEFAELVVDAIRHAGVLGKTTIQSFDIRPLQYLHQNHPGIQLALLVEGTDTVSVEGQLKRLGFTPQIYSPHYSLVNPTMLHTCKNLKMQVVPWTVNSLTEMQRLKDLGVDGIISDYPNLFKELR